MTKSLEHKIATVEERVARLKSVFKELDRLEDYLSAPDRKDIAERNLQVAIEACLDIGKIIIAEEGFREPGDSKGIFVVLSEEGIVSSESLSFLIPMAGMRNVLVHGYDKVDDSLIYGIIKKRLKDFHQVLTEIRKSEELRLKPTGTPG